MLWIPARLTRGGAKPAQGPCTVTIRQRQAGEYLCIATPRAQSLSSNMGTALKTGTTLLSSCLWCPHTQGHVQQCDLLLLRRTPGEDTIFLVPSEHARSDIKLQKNAQALLPPATTSCQHLMTGPEQNSKATISPFPAEKLNSFMACNS